jgi:uncharacterized membrane protein
MGLLLVSIFNSVVFGTAGIFLTSKLTWSGGIMSILIASGMFVLSGIAGYLSLKQEKLVDRIKGI